MKEVLLVASFPVCSRREWGLPPLLQRGESWSSCPVTVCLCAVVALCNVARRITVDLDRRKKRKSRALEFRERCGDRGRRGYRRSARELLKQRTDGERESRERESRAIELFRNQIFLAENSDSWIHFSYQKLQRPTSARRSPKKNSSYKPTFPISSFPTLNLNSKPSGIITKWEG